MFPHLMLPQLSTLLMLTRLRSADVASVTGGRAGGVSLPLLLRGLTGLRTGGGEFPTDHRRGDPPVGDGPSTNCTAGGDMERASTSGGWLGVRPPAWVAPPPLD